MSVSKLWILDDFSLARPPKFIHPKKYNHKTWEIVEGGKWFPPPLVYPCDILCFFVRMDWSFIMNETLKIVGPLLNLFCIKREYPLHLQKIENLTPSPSQMQKKWLENKEKMTLLSESRFEFSSSKNFCHGIPIFFR